MENNEQHMSTQQVEGRKPTVHSDATHHPYSKLLLTITAVIVVLAGAGSAYLMYSAKQLSKDSQAKAVTQASASPTATATAEVTPTPTSTGTTDAKEEIKADVKALNDEVKAAISKMQEGF